MEKENIYKLLDKLILKNGAKNQLIKAIEELHELHHSICRFLLLKEEERNKNIENIIEEVVDVNIVLIQIEMILISLCNKNSDILADYFQKKIKKIKEYVAKTHID